MNKIGIFNETKENLNNDMKEIKRIIKYGLKKENISNAQLNIIIVNNDMIKIINKDYRKIDKATDVISFALEDEKDLINGYNIRVLGDIYISIDKVFEQAKAYNHSIRREICFLAIHGFYHLLGYDHQNGCDEKIMFAKQEEVLNNYGITKETKGS